MSSTSLFQSENPICSYSPLEIQTIKDKIWNITEELYNDESNGFQQVFRKFNDYLMRITNDISHTDSEFRMYASYFNQFQNRNTPELMSELKTHLQYTNDTTIIYKLDQVINAIGDYNYNATDKHLQTFQLTYFYNKILSEMSANFDEYSDELQLYNTHIDKLDSDEQRSVRSQYLYKNSFQWYNHLEFINITDKIYNHMKEFIKYFMPKLDTTNSAPIITMSKPQKKSAASNSTNSSASKKPTKKKIPAALRNAVWNESNGSESKVGPCYVCKETITFSSFHCGHVQAEANGGDVTLINLKPICGLCNSSMGKMNMTEFITKYGFDKIKSKDKTVFKLSKKATIETVMKNLNKKDQKTVSSILYKNKLCNLSHIL